MNITKQTLAKIAEIAAADLRGQVDEAGKDLINAIEKAQEEAALQESKPKFSVGFKIAVDLEKDEFDCSLSWSVKQSLSTSHKLDDKDQPKLPLN